MDFEKRLHHKFLFEFGGGVCCAIINSPDQYMRLVWALTKPPKPAPPCFPIKKASENKGSLLLGVVDSFGTIDDGPETYKLMGWSLVIFRMGLTKS